MERYGYCILRPNRFTCDVAFACKVKPTAYNPTGSAITGDPGKWTRLWRYTLAIEKPDTLRRHPLVGCMGEKPCPRCRRAVKRLGENSRAEGLPAPHVG
jgi:hypothetical protein